MKTWLVLTYPTGKNTPAFASPFLFMLYTVLLELVVVVGIDLRYRIYCKLYKLCVEVLCVWLSCPCQENCL